MARICEASATARLQPELPAWARGTTCRRGEPFAGLSEHAPSALTALGYAAEIAAATKLIKAARKGKPAKPVVAACNAIEGAAKKTGEALKVYDAKHKDWLKALAARDAHGAATRRCARTSRAPPSRSSPSATGLA